MRALSLFLVLTVVVGGCGSIDDHVVDEPIPVVLDGFVCGPFESPTRCAELSALATDQPFSLDPPAWVPVCGEHFGASCEQILVARSDGYTDLPSLEPALAELDRLCAAESVYACDAAYRIRRRLEPTDACRSCAGGSEAACHDCLQQRIETSSGSIEAEEELFGGLCALPTTSLDVCHLALDYDDTDSSQFEDAIEQCERGNAGTCAALLHRCGSVDTCAGHPHIRGLAESTLATATARCLLSHPDGPGAGFCRGAIELALELGTTNADVAEVASVYCELYYQSGGCGMWDLQCPRTIAELLER